MAIDPGAFSAMARSEFMNGMAAAFEKPVPAKYDGVTTTIPSTAKVETHTYMSNLPRLYRFKGYSPSVRLVDKVYQVPNHTWRVGPISVKKDDLDDDQIGGYLNSINALPARASKDIGHEVCSHLAAGTSNLCFDATAFFANSHTFGSGNNLDTANMAASDAATHKIIALVTDNPGMKPVLFQDRESLSGLQTDEGTPQAAKLREYEYWADTRFGLGYGYWWDGYHLTITDTPTIPEIIETLIPQIINGLRTFTLPKGRDSDSALYVHEGWEPMASNFYLLCNLALGEKLSTAVSLPNYANGSTVLNNTYHNKATVIPTSALGT